MQDDLAQSNSLTDLAARIRSEHAARSAAMKRGLQHALPAGDLLIEAKAQLQHGQWLAWLREHCDLRDRTARAYMRLARHRAKLDQIGNVADLTFRGVPYALTVHLPYDDDDSADWESITPKYEAARAAMRAAVDHIGLGSIEDDIALFDDVFKALTEAEQADEAADIPDLELKLRAYVRQAKDETLVAGAVEIRFLMERRVGRMLASDAADAR